MEVNSLECNIIIANGRLHLAHCHIFHCICGAGRKVRCTIFCLEHFLIPYLAHVFALFFSRWLHVNYFISLIRCIFKAAIKLKRKLAARKSKFQQELEKIAAQYGVLPEEV